MKEKTRPSFSGWCNVCCRVVRFLFSHDDGRDEVYICQECGCLHRVAVR